MKKIVLGLLMIQLVVVCKAQNSDTSTDADALAQKLLNPVASLISVPFQGNFDYGIGPNNGSRFTMNMQPVVPISISEDWNLIGRLILPLISQSDVFGPSGNQFGLGDAVVSGFFSPKAPTASGIIWGVGPAILVPTATNNMLGSEKFGVGPTAVILKQAGSVTIGALANHIWSIAGSNNRSDVSSTFFQPFIAKNFSGGYALALNTELVQNWENRGTSGFVHLIGSKVISVGNQMGQIFLGPRIPYGGANTTDWGFRAGLTLLFPK